MIAGSVLEACCGAGGEGYGFSKYFEIAHAFDIKPEAVSTYGANNPDTNVRRQDIRLLTGCRGDYDGITGVIGGPPCQGSSIINTKRCADDPRNGLMNEFMRLVEEIQPRFFMMENVPGVPKERKEEVIRLGEKAGYVVVSKIVNSSNHGAPQTRERWITIGIKGRAWVEPPRRPAKTVRDAFANLGPLWGQMQSRPDTLERLSHAVVGKWMPMDPTKKFDGMTRLAWDQPSLAIVNLKKVYMRHPDENRNISLAEAAALQGFPPDYIWHGTDSQKAQMIANAMPTPLAESIAASIAAGYMQELAGGAA